MSRREINVREMLLELKVPPFLADMAIPFMWFMPATIDPDSPSVIEINRGIQRGLRSLGFKGVRVNGILDRQTTAALNQVSAPNKAWMHKTFVQIYGDIIQARKDPDRKSFQAAALAGYFEYQGPPVGPLPGSMVGLPPGPLGMGLDWGHGTKDPRNCVGIGSTKNVFKELQRQTNRLASKFGTSRVGVDGIIGPATLSATRAVAIKIWSPPAEMWTSPSFTCDILGKHAEAVLQAFRREADKVGAPQSVPPPSGGGGPRDTPGPVIDPNSVPSAGLVPGGAFAALTKYAPFLLLAGGVAWYANERSKKGKRKR